ncbi:hypothetical protein V7114_20685 [Neobacillus niacini]|uniref:hypothetical protein n=1 Tax=Neobacillus niacini TaxID=86668 RepID=UPI002FFF7723
MNVLIVIHYISSENKVMRRGEFPLKRKTKEEAALEFWKWIKREHPYECIIEKVIVDGEDITERVEELERSRLNESL